MTLAEQYGVVRRLALDPQGYVGPDARVAFDVTTTDGFIAGIAQRLLAGKPLADDEVKALRTPFLVDDRWCGMPELGPYSLGHLPKVLHFARELERLRQLCVETVRTP